MTAICLLKKTVGGGQTKHKAAGTTASVEVSVSPFIRHQRKGERPTAAIHTD